MVSCQKLSQAVLCQKQMKGIGVLYGKLLGKQTTKNIQVSRLISTDTRSSRQWFPKLVLLYRFVPECIHNYIPDAILAVNK